MITHLHAAIADLGRSSSHLTRLTIALQQALAFFGKNAISAGFNVPRLECPALLASVCVLRLCSLGRVLPPVPRTDVNDSYEPNGIVRAL